MAISRVLMWLIEVINLRTKSTRSQGPSVWISFCDMQKSALAREAV